VAKVIVTSSSGVLVRRLTLYKHGVAFVERQGQFSGEALSLNFRASEVNDALKSLLAIDHGGGQVLGIHYDTPADRQTRLAAGPINLSDKHSLLDLLRALRGSRVRLVVDAYGTSEELTGRLIGVDVPRPKSSEMIGVATVLDDSTGAVQTVGVGNVRQVFILEERAAQDLRYFLDTVRSEDTHRSITVRLSPGDHDLTVSYLVPSPTWRVSYRLVAETADGSTASAGPAGAPAGTGGNLLLQGWGLFDNPLEEDLQDVSVTLVAGQPISFVYDLATSRIPERPVVEDNARVAAGPVAFEAGVTTLAELAPPADWDAARRPPRPAAAAPAFMRSRAAAPSIEYASKQAIAATATGLAELFQYEVLPPVTVGRGASALVPILSTQLPYRRRLLYNEQKLAGHPVATLSFGNATGLVLERGPVTVLEDGAYHGEAIVPFTRDGAEVHVAFAVELGIAVTLTREVSTQLAGIRVSGALLHQQQATVTRTIYRLENRLPSKQTVILEHPIDAGAELVEPNAPEEQTAEWYRWTVSCPAHRATVFAVSQRRYQWQTSQVLDQSYEQLAEFLRRRWLDRSTLDRLRGLLDAKAAMARNAEERSRLQGERDGVYAREEQLRKNIGTLGAGGDEGVLRAEALVRLRTCEHRVEDIGASLSALEEQDRAHQAAIQTELGRLEVDGRSGTPAAEPAG